MYRYSDERVPYSSLKAKEKKEIAQDIIMHQISTALGYWQEAGLISSDDFTVDIDEMSEKEKEHFQSFLQREADRLAKVFGYSRAWTS